MKKLFLTPWLGCSFLVSMKAGITWRVTYIYGCEFVQQENENKETIKFRVFVNEWMKLSPLDIEVTNHSLFIDKFN